MSKTLARLVSRGVEVSLLTGNADHRAPRRVGDYLLRHGAAVYRFTDPAGLPMHSKFMLAESDCVRWASFGSYNLTLSSRWLNHELLMFSENPDLWDALDRRWKEMLSSGSIGRGADHMKFRL
jgi:phosphatidylserine/phosphatidylglycerophosphate/cardiolipin synthase-like enzyme